MSFFKSLTFAAIAAAVTFGALADAAQQTPAAKTAAAASTTTQAAVEGGTPTYFHPETPEQRRERLGTAEDPGPDPDPKKIFWRFGKSYHIEKFPRKWAAYDRVPLGWVRPLAQVNSGFELYQQNDQYVWTWIPEETPATQAAAAEPPASDDGWTPERLNYLQKNRGEYSELTPPESGKTILFEEASDGLPSTGSWRNSLAIADMNGDGFLDIIAPPERGIGGGTPAIFLGDGKGHWKLWRDVKWPHAIDYGAVVAADFNHDGHMDLAFAIHLNGVRVWLGDGKGNFTESSKGLPVDGFPTRKLIAVDLDHDGYPDLLAISEGATARGLVGGAKVRAFYNRKKATQWEEVPAVSGDESVAGDSLAVGNFNGDPYPDIVDGSIFFQAIKLIWVSDGPRKWVAAKQDDAIIPMMSWYTAVATGHMTSKKTDDIVMTYSRQWPTDTKLAAPPLQRVVGVDLVRFNGPNAKRTAIVRAPGSRSIMGLGTGDFDGDGNLDIVYVPWEPKREFVILLGDGKGGFTRARLEGIKAEPQTNYDLTIADVNGDGRPDIIIAYESDKQGSMGVQNGSIHVFLNRGIRVEGAQKTK